MGLASALSTALTGLTAAESQIDVVGNNLANSQTVGFKSSDVIFSTQFLQTLGLGSSPTAESGGTNPRQTGLGTQVAEISPDFTQGTIEISSNPSDLAIQGDGFFMVEGNQGETLYTRNGIFKTNSQNELVTINGQRLLGFGVDEFFNIQTTQLEPLSIPLGSAAVAQATQNVFFEGTLPASGDIADTASVIESAVLGDAAIPRPDLTGDTDGDGTPDVAPTTASPAPTPDSAGVTSAISGGGNHSNGQQYEYRFAFVDDSGTETLASDSVAVTVNQANGTVTLNNLPTDAAIAEDFNQLRIYRTEAGSTGPFEDADFFELATIAEGTTTFVDDGTSAVDTNSPLDTSTINGNYSYLVTFHKNGQQESRPSLLLGPQNVANGRVRLTDLPTPPTPGAGDSFPAYDEVRIYRNLATDSSTFYLVDTVAPGEEYIDSKTDAMISDLNVSGNKVLDEDGPKIAANTLLTNVIRRDGLNYENVFTEGELAFSGRKGGRSLATENFTVTSTSTVQDLIDFMHDSMGIQVAADDPQNPIPSSVNNIAGETTALAPGGTIKDGKIRFVANNGVDNAIDVGLSAFELTDGTGTISSPNLGFGTIQEASGQSAATDFIVFDSLGAPLSVRVTMTLESRTGVESTYRWYADSADNDPSTGVDLSVGTGLVRFDGEGNLVSVTNSTASIERRNSPATSPLEFELDFSQVSGLSAEEPSIAASRQDGSSTGTLNSFIIGENGIIRGVFSNGISRDLGQIRLASFANPSGLEQAGENLFAAGVNSGLPVEGNPGQQGIGTVVAGAVELSNTDIGQNLIDLVLASTQYRGNTRVITTSQQLLDELLNLRR